VVKNLTYGQKTKKTPCNSYNSWTKQNQHMFIKLKLKTLKLSTNWCIVRRYLTGQILKFNWSKLKKTFFLNFSGQNVKKKYMLFILKLKLLKRSTNWCITWWFFTEEKWSYVFSCGNFLNPRVVFYSFTIVPRAS